MCELFGVSSAGKIRVNELLREFYSHSEHHPDGWGLAIFYENSVSLEKEPVKASASQYLKERLRHKIEVKNMLAHIRLATRGNTEYENSHPFVRRDNCGRTWTLVHNGTIFEYPPLSHYVYEQEGKTDSERILCYLIDRINKKQTEIGHMLNAGERFHLLDVLVCDMAEGNKLNLLLYDGEFLYAHSNYANSLYVRQTEGAALFATVPLGRSDWELLPFTALCAYKDGKKVREGTRHEKEYKDNEADLKYLFTDYASL